MIGVSFGSRDVPKGRAMADQTRNEWRLGVTDDDRGTLVVITDQGMAPVLQNLAAGFAMQSFAIAEESQIKLFFQGVPYGLASDPQLQQFEFAWIPGGIVDFLLGVCGGDDCEAARACVRPGCLCKKGMITGKWKCR
jgi:hypothetical protein